MARVLIVDDALFMRMLLKNIIEKVEKRYNVGRPRVVVGVPSGITEVEITPNWWRI